MQAMLVLSSWPSLQAQEYQAVPAMNLAYVTKIESWCHNGGSYHTVRDDNVALFCCLVLSHYICNATPNLKHLILCNYY